MLVRALNTTTAASLHQATAKAAFVPYLSGNYSDPYLPFSAGLPVNAGRTALSSPAGS